MSRLLSIAVSRLFGRTQHGFVSHDAASAKLYSLDDEGRKIRAEVAAVHPANVASVEAQEVQPLTASKLIAKCVADIRTVTRSNEVAATNGNAERWAERLKRAKLRGVKADDYCWGTIFNGSKAALIKAGLADAKSFPAKGKERKYQLPLNYGDGYNAACYGPTFGAIPPSWSARISHSMDSDGTYSVYVDFNTDDLKVRERTDRAFDEMDRPDMNLALLRQLVAEIPPLPLSVTIPEQIKAARKYPRSEK